MNHDSQFIREEQARQEKLDAFWERAAPFLPFLSDTTVNEIAVNDPGTVWLGRGGQWTPVEAPKVTKDLLASIGTRLADYAGKSFDRTTPTLSTVLPSGQRVEMSHPPACPEHTHYLNIRSKEGVAFPHMKLVEQGYYENTRHEYSLTLDDDERAKLAEMLTPEEAELWKLARNNEWPEFVRLAVAYYQNIVISGATGSGKTSYMRALVDLIDPADRIITLEDSHELMLPNHPNHNHLFYKKNTNDEGATADELLHSVMRKTPTRVIMAELRGQEAMTYLSDVITSGHPGGITTAHSGSPKQARLRLAYLIRKSPSGRDMSMDTVLQLLNMAINVIIQLNLDRQKGSRHVPAIYYDPMFTMSLLG